MYLTIATTTDNNKLLAIDNNLLVPNDPHYKLVLLHDCDDGMINTFYHHDLLIINTHINTIDCDAIFEIRLNNRSIIRRVQRLPNNELLIITDNEHYPNFTVSKDSLQVLGRVIQSWKATRHSL